MDTRLNAYTSLEGVTAIASLNTSLGNLCHMHREHILKRNRGCGVAPVVGKVLAHDCYKYQKWGTILDFTVLYRILPYYVPKFLWYGVGSIRLCAWVSRGSAISALEKAGRWRRAMKMLRIWDFRCQGVSQNCHLQLSSLIIFHRDTIWYNRGIKGSMANNVKMD